ncbi:MAG: TolC family protein [Betaproteobacteria bacterium]|nr:TolC family protein [Betaproteobacteria bacterium]
MKFPLLLLACFAGVGVLATAGAQPLSLADALRAGESQAPRLAAQRFAVDSAGQQVGRARELPDPRLKLGLENLPVSGASRFRYDQDFMTQRTVGIAQDFPNEAKRAARNDRALRQRDMEEANFAAQRALVQREIAAAWLEVHYAERALILLRRLADQYRLQSDAAVPGVARGRQTAADGYALRTAFEQANDRILEQEKAVAKARNTLAAWIGAEAGRPLAAAPDITRFDHPLEHLVAGLPQHPTLRTFDLREELARSEVNLAKATRDRDWSLEVGYSQRGPAFDNMISVVVAIDLPIAKEKRQERDIASRLAEVEQVRAQREDARRMHEAEVRNLQADWQTAGKRIERYDTVLLPLARERAQAALAAYQGGRGELGAVLEADRAVLETELARVQSETERAKAWAGLNYLDPVEGKS